MPQQVEPATPVPPSAYTEEYFRNAVEGHEEFRRSKGRHLSPRLERALALADPRPGQRMLDIACGRGELALHSTLRGAQALAIDYAEAATHVASETLAGAGRAGVARMDATRLALRPGSFDAAVMLDFVEHVYQPDLETALEEVRRALRPGGRVIVHTSPNRVFEEVVYRHYVRNVHRALLAICARLRIHNRLINKMMLPTGPLPPHDEYERKLHVNPQSGASLRDALRRHGFRVRHVDYWEPPDVRVFPPEERGLNRAVAALDVVRFLRPFSRFPPLNRFFSNHLWVVAERSA